MANIALTQIRNSRNIQDSPFLDAYSKLITKKPLNDGEKLRLLEIALVFLGSQDANVQKFGYAIILTYSNRFNDYRPLYDVAMSRDYVPIAAFIERQRGQSQVVQMDNFSDVLISSYKENFKSNIGGDNTYRSRGQILLNKFAQENTNIVVVAPTSYGKSEMLVDKIRSNLSEKLCVVVPTKALLAQTKSAILRNDFISKERPRIIAHPDMYRGESSFVAVLTQERLLRILKKNNDLAFDRILVDEAHNILDDEVRARLLAQVLLIAKRRNPSLDVSFFTPFLADPYSVKLINHNAEVLGKKVDEHMKIEKLYYTNLLSQQLFLYDQFTNRSFLTGNFTAHDTTQFLIDTAGSKNIVYINRPQHVEKVALDLAQKMPVIKGAEEITKAISKLIHSEYNLIECIRHGILYHHGGLPDVVRLYVEDLFSKSDDFSFLITTSTLLEGVNTPAEKMFILNPRKGRPYLSASQFKNLIGRICRFKEVFDPEKGKLMMLEPEVYLLDGEYSPNSFSPLSFYQKVANSSIIIRDDVKNPLLQSSNESEARGEALHYLENVEPGASGLLNLKVAQTNIGRLCFANNVHDFNILKYEDTLEYNLKMFAGSFGLKISNSTMLISAICQIFFTGIDLSQAESLERIAKYQPARNFYSMFVEWRTKGVSYGQMISSFLHYWDTLSENKVFIGERWGEETLGDRSVRTLWVDMSKKTHSQRVNLAIAKIKEEQDFIDFKLMMYVEILNDLEMVDKVFYDQVKFGTENRKMICLLKNGLSFELSRLLVNNYLSFISFDLENDFAEYGPRLITELEAKNENQILIFEAKKYL